MILGFSGKALSGKDTAADYLLQDSFWYKKTAFANNLKNMCSYIFCLPKPYFYTQCGKRERFAKPVVFL